MHTHYTWAPELLDKDICSEIECGMSVIFRKAVQRRSSDETKTTTNEHCAYTMLICRIVELGHSWWYFVIDSFIYSYKRWGEPKNSTISKPWNINTNISNAFSEQIFHHRTIWDVEPLYSIQCIEIPFWIHKESELLIFFLSFVGAVWVLRVNSELFLFRNIMCVHLVSFR